MNDVRLQVKADHLKAAKQGCWRGRSQALRAQPRRAAGTEEVIIQPRRLNPLSLDPGGRNRL